MRNRKWNVDLQTIPQLLQQEPKEVCTSMGKCAERPLSTEFMVNLNKFVRILCSFISVVSQFLSPIRKGRIAAMVELEVHSFLNLFQPRCKFEDGLPAL